MLLIAMIRTILLLIFLAVGSGCKLPAFMGVAQKCEMAGKTEAGDCCNGFKCVNEECIPAVSSDLMNPADFALVAHAVVMQATNYSDNLLKSIDAAATEVARANDKLERLISEASQKYQDSYREGQAGEQTVKERANEKLATAQKQLAEAASSAKDSVRDKVEKLKQMLRKALEPNAESSSTSGTVHVSSFNSVENRKGHSHHRHDEEKDDEFESSRAEDNTENSGGQQGDRSKYLPPGVRGSTIGKEGDKNTNDEQGFDWQKFVPGSESQKGESASQDTRTQNVVMEVSSNRSRSGETPIGPTAGFDWSKYVPEGMGPSCCQGHKKGNVGSVGGFDWSKYVPEGMGSSSQQSNLLVKDTSTTSQSHSYGDNGKSEVSKYEPRSDFDPSKFSYHTVIADESGEKTPEETAEEANGMALLAADAAEILAGKLLTAAAHLRQSAESLRKKAEDASSSSNENRSPYYFHNAVTTDANENVLEAHRNSIYYVGGFVLLIIVLGMAYARFSRRRHNYERI